MFPKEIDGLRYSDHFPGDGPRFGKQACSMGMEGVTSKRVDRPYAPATVDLVPDHLAAIRNSAGLDATH